MAKHREYASPLGRALVTGGITLAFTIGVVGLLNANGGEAKPRLDLSVELAIVAGLTGAAKNARINRERLDTLEKGGPR